MLVNLLKKYKMENSMKNSSKKKIKALKDIMVTRKIDIAEAVKYPVVMEIMKKLSDDWSWNLFLAYLFSENYLTWCRRDCDKQWY